MLRAWVRDFVLIVFHFMHIACLGVTTRASFQGDEAKSVGGNVSWVKMSCRRMEIWVLLQFPCWTCCSKSNHSRCQSLPVFSAE
ncbi:hypothetical protein SCLCIDRAFT_1186550 [Scleroderma citrinum Foug A]|uniref:Secreted protein n=1 Tax=Scleroderma citrinum Foug A TaxID=1036808 RepID=A0A0C3EIW8_9AGAM|nr:hypothetical protein SCLCIDRAFT_1186550 [Scleroderma citrinum Foug A]